MPHRILIIDDEPVLRLTFRHFLEQHGYEVILAEDGAKGLEACRQAPPELVITDLCMPGLNGFETITALHAETPDLPIIAMSGVASSCGRQHTLACGATCCVSKPLDLHALLHLVEGIVSPQENGVPR